MLEEVLELAVEFLADLIRNRLVRPDLAVRMRIARAHDLAAVLEDLYVVDVVKRTQSLGFFAPGVDHRPDFLPAHPSERQIMPRRET